MTRARPLLAAALLLAAAVALLAWALRPRDEAAPAIVARFDDAAYLVPGQDVRIAGAVAGSVRSVHLARDRDALVALDVDPRFTPFHADARCTIRPQSLIGERYVDCSPGTPRARPLPRDARGSQLLPLARTGSPIDLDLVLDTLDRPVSQRLALIVTELGGGLAGRGEDLNAAIHRAVPALGDANRLLRVLERDRRRIGVLLDASDRVLAGVAARRAAVPAFVRRAGAVTAVTARREQDLRATLRRLPALLRTSRGALQELRGAAEDGLPVVRDLRRAAPAVNATVGAIAPLARAGTPAVDGLGTAAGALRPGVGALVPVARAARPFATLARPTAAVLDELLTSLRDRGATRGLLTFLMNAALATSRYDDTSHVLTATQLTGKCSLYAATPDPDCDAHFAAGRKSATRAAREHRGQRRRPSRRPGGAAAPAPAAAAPGAPAPAAPRPGPQQGGGTTITIPGLPPIELPSLLPHGGGTGDAGRDRGDGDLQGLLELLLR